MNRKELKKGILRVKQLADQGLGRYERTVVLSEELISLEKEIEKIRLAFSNSTKNLQTCISSPSLGDVDKRLKKLPEYIFSTVLHDSSTNLNTPQENIFGKLFFLCGDVEQNLAREIVHYGNEVDTNVLQPLQTILDKDMPSISRLKKQLVNLTLDWDAIRNKNNKSAQIPVKQEALKDEIDQAEIKVEQCKDQYEAEIYSFFSKETQLCKIFTSLIECQISHHRRCLNILDNMLPIIKQEIEIDTTHPLFGQNLEDHLNHSHREIAVVVEECVRLLLKKGIDDEGIFRIAPSKIKLNKLQSAFDANMFEISEYESESHCLSGALKSYFRELPDPLLTFQFFDDWIQAIQKPQEDRLNALWIIVDKMKQVRPFHYNNLRYIIKFLALVSSHCEFNKMNSTNLAIVFAPNLLWPSHDDRMNIRNSAAVTNIVDVLISSSEWFFPGDLDFMSVISSNSNSPSLTHREPASSQERVKANTIAKTNFLSLPKSQTGSTLQSNIGSHLFTKGSSYTLHPTKKPKKGPAPTPPTAASLLGINIQNKEINEQKQFLPTYEDRRKTDSYRQNLDMKCCENELDVENRQNLNRAVSFENLKYGLLESNKVLSSSEALITSKNNAGINRWTSFKDKPINKDELSIHICPKEISLDNEATEKLPLNKAVVNEISSKKLKSTPIVGTKEKLEIGKVENVYSEQTKNLKNHSTDSSEYEDVNEGIDLSPLVSQNIFSPKDNELNQIHETSHFDDSNNAEVLTTTSMEMVSKTEIKSLTESSGKEFKSQSNDRKTVFINDNFKQQNELELNNNDQCKSSNSSLEGDVFLLAPENLLPCQNKDEIQMRNNFQSSLDSLNLFFKQNSIKKDESQSLGELPEASNSPGDDIHSSFTIGDRMTTSDLYPMSNEFFIESSDYINRSVIEDRKAMADHRHDRVTSIKPVHLQTTSSNPDKTQNKTDGITNGERTSFLDSLSPKKHDLILSTNKANISPSPTLLKSENAASLEDAFATVNSDSPKKQTNSPPLSGSPKYAKSVQSSKVQPPNDLPKFDLQTNSLKTPPPIPPKTKYFKNDSIDSPINDCTKL